MIVLMGFNCSKFYTNKFLFLSFFVFHFFHSSLSVGLMTLVLDYFSKLNRFVANLHVWTSDLVVSTCSLVHLHSEPAEKGLVPLYSIYMPGYVPL